MTQARVDAMPLAVAVVVGAALGWLAARVVLVGSGLSLVPWALAGLALGACCRSTPRAALVGACFGFVLAFTFMVAGYDGDDPFTDVLVPVLLLGLVGAVCGTVLAVVGRLGKQVLMRSA